MIHCKKVSYQQLNFILNTNRLKETTTNKVFTVAQNIVYPITNHTELE
jgi:hypothetical protein